MSLPTGSLIAKDPQAAALPKGIDWTDYLAKIGPTETITTSTWSITGADAALTYASPSIVTGSKQTQMKLSGGTLGVEYRVTNQIITSGGATDERSFFVLIQNL